MDPHRVCSRRCARTTTFTLATQLPARRAIEVKGTGDEVAKIALSAQVTTYLARYGQVLVTNYRDFVLVERGPGQTPVLRERYSLAPSEADFWSTNAQQIAARHADPLQVL